MKKILFPTDFSECAQNALNYAIAFAAAYNSKLVLYHAYAIPIPPAELPGYYDEAGAEALRVEASRKLKSWKEIVEKSGFDIECETRLEPGPIEGNLLRYVKEAGIDEVIMGTEGAKGLKRIFLGSHAARIVSEAPCPVMIVPDDQEFNGINKMVYATNYYDENQETLDGLIDLAVRLDAELKVVHYVDPKEDFTQEIFAWYQEVLKDKYPDINMTFELLYGDTVGKALESYMETTKSDLLVMINRKKGLWDSLFTVSQTKKMTLHAETVVLVFHPDGKKVASAV